MNCHEKSSCINIYCCHGNGENGGGTVIPGSLQTDWYVSNTGDNVSGDGTADNPFKTIQHTVDTISMSSNSTLPHRIYVADGTYIENLIIRGLNLHIIGNTDNPENVKIGGTANFRQVIVEAYSATTFEGVQFDGSTGMDLYGDTILISSSACSLKNCVFMCNNAFMNDIQAHGNSYCEIADISFAGNERWRLLSSFAGSIIWVYEECRTLNPMTVSGELVDASAMGNLYIDAPITCASGTITGRKYSALSFGKIYSIANLPVTSIQGSVATGGQAI